MTKPKKPKQVKVLKAGPPATVQGKHGRSFSGSRKATSFTDDPKGFQTEKDPRKNPSNKWFDLPPATGVPPYRLDLSTVLSEQAMQGIAANKRLVFHTFGDSGGVNTTTYQQQVASYMELDFQEKNANGANPSFLYHLGDVVYYSGEVINYYWEFYEPYENYPAPVFAIPGNHDGDVDPNDEFNTPADSLKGFVRNFCAQAPIRLPEAKDAPRDAMTQPNVYWTLNTPMATIIGLYTNVKEGGQVSPAQITWLEQELEAAPADQAVILALHHPILSAYGGHPGSQAMKTIVEEACKAAGRTPNLILTAHVHDYQRFTASINGKPVTTIVAGAGGYNQKLHRLDAKTFTPDGCPYKFDNGEDVLEAFNDTQHGYLIIDVTAGKINCSYIAVDDPTAAQPGPTSPGKPYETFEITL
jgi:hypothetical protein